MSVLISVLQNDRMDVEIIKAALETLNILCTIDSSGVAYFISYSSSFFFFF